MSMAVEQPPGSHPPKSSHPLHFQGPLQSSSSSGKKLKDLIFKRRKSNTQTPNLLEVRHSLTGDTSPRAPRKSGVLAVAPHLAPGTNRPRSQSVFDQNSALKPQIWGQLNIGEIGKGEKKNSLTPTNKEQQRVVEKNRNLARPSSNNPLQNRILQGRRCSVDSRSTTPLGPNGSSLSPPLLSVGPSEFYEMFRGRTYSDSKNLEAKLSAAEARRRKLSEFKQPQTSGENDSPSPPHDSSPPPLSPSQLSTGSQGVNSPQTIFEHVEVQFDSNTLTPTKLTNQRPRRGSVFAHAPVIGGGELSGRDSDVSPGLIDRRKIGRRYSLPCTDSMTSQPGSLFRQCLNRESAEKAMSNFPKFTTSVPPSAIKSSDLGIDLPSELRPFVIWRNKAQGSHMFRLPLDEEEWQELTTDDPVIRNAMYYRTMGRHKCYELMPNSSKLVLLDKDLLVISSFYALLFNGIRAAPVWDSESKTCTGMLTVTDFIKVLQHCYTTEDKTINLEGHKISTWKSLLTNPTYHTDMVSIDPDASLLEAIQILRENRIHRLLVQDVDSESSLYILTSKRILHYLYLLTQDLPKPWYMKQPIGKLDVGTYKNIATITGDTRLIEALRLMTDHHISSLPVLDSSGRVTNIYTRADVMNLVVNESYKNLDNTVQEALNIPRESFEGLYICSRTDTLETVVNWLVRMNIHRILVVDSDRRLEGVVSVSDVINYMILKQAPPTVSPPEKEETSDLIDFEESSKEIPAITIEFNEKL